MVFTRGNNKISLRLSSGRTILQSQSALKCGPNGSLLYGPEPGNYVISNILPTEVGDKAAFWNCDVKVKPGDLATEKPILISNPENKDPRDIKNIKCVAVEKPLPACPAPA